MQAGRLNVRFHQVFHLVLAARCGRSQWEPLYSDTHGRSERKGATRIHRIHKVQPLTRSLSRLVTGCDRDRLTGK
jgi:hypothetical protein